ncbi:hypothetical protein MLD38_011163 [Melastoma candidum]|uniref:Uncharacterized protein n=1 Tax=Melastoma candidum TaxID=119954 RepID=A0ACB9R259_9MYRT|nr:hypothetical protein MLD38_011163 [Melastoma candidum]
MHFFSLSSSASSSHHPIGDDLVLGGAGSSPSFEFDFSSRAGSPGRFYQEGEGVQDVEEQVIEEEDEVDVTASYLPFDWNDKDDDYCPGGTEFAGEEEGKDGSAEKKEGAMSSEAVPSMSASSSRSSSAGRSSKRWVFLKDFLRSKSEGSSNNEFWATISFSPGKDKRPQSNNVSPTEKPNGPIDCTGDPAKRIKRVNSTVNKKGGGASKGRSGVTGGKKKLPVMSAHELHYMANRAHSEELRKRTFLPHREGLFGCLGPLIRPN